MVARNANGPDTMPGPPLFIANLRNTDDAAAWHALSSTFSSAATSRAQAAGPANCTRSIGGGDRDGLDGSKIVAALAKVRKP